MTHSALVRWRPPEERGRKALPATLRYVGLSRFSHEAATWPDGAWSVELRFAQPPAEVGEGTMCEATVRFLFDHAPQEWMQPGTTFSIYEGPTRVADVDILD